MARRWQCCELVSRAPRRPTPSGCGNAGSHCNIERLESKGQDQAADDFPPVLPRSPLRFHARYALPAGVHQHRGRGRRRRRRRFGCRRCRHVRGVGTGLFLGNARLGRASGCRLVRPEVRGRGLVDTWGPWLLRALGQERLHNRDGAAAQRQRQLASSSSSSNKSSSKLPPGVTHLEPAAWHESEREGRRGGARRTEVPAGAAWDRSLYKCEVRSVRWGLRHLETRPSPLAETTMFSLNDVQRWPRPESHNRPSRGLCAANRGD